MHDVGTDKEIESIDEIHRKEKAYARRYDMYLSADAPSPIFATHSQFSVNRWNEGEHDGVLGKAVIAHLEHAAKEFRLMANRIRLDMKEHPNAWRELPTLTEFMNKRRKNDREI